LPLILIYRVLDLWIENYSGIARIPCDSTAFLLSLCLSFYMFAMGLMPEINRWWWWRWLV